MNFFTDVQFLVYRAYYGKLADLISILLNIFLFITGIMYCITGPVLSYFDYNHMGPCPKTDEVKLWMEIHILHTYVFVVAQLIYLFT